MSDIEQCDGERTFHLFSRLPAELRWKIWALNLPGPRVVSVRCGSEPSPDGTGRHYSSSSLLSYPGGGCTSPAPIPSNLHVCHESRREALRRYRLSFGIAQQPGRIFFDPDEDILYFGPRDGFMASEAQLRTVLTLCCPEELRRVRKVALNDALFWVYESSNRSSNFAFSSQTAPPSPSRVEEHTIMNYSYHGRQQQNHRPGGIGAGGLAHATIAMSLLINTLELLHTRLPGLRELIFVPRDENPLYSRDCCLVEPVMVQSRMVRQVREAMTTVFGGGPDTSAAAYDGQKYHQEKILLTNDNGDDDDFPWTWRVMTLSANPDPPVYGPGVLGWEEDDEVGVDDDQPQQSLQGGWQGARPDVDAVGGYLRGRMGRYKKKREVIPPAATALGVEMTAVPATELTTRTSAGEEWERGGKVVGEGTRLGALQEGMRTRFMKMEMGVCV